MARPEVGRLVLRAPNWLGDAVMAIPAMEAIRLGSPGAHLAVAAPASVAPLFSEVTSVRPDEVIVLSSKGKPARAAIAAGRFDACVLFPNSFRTGWDAKRAGIQERWGYGTAGRGWLLTNAVRKPPRRSALHQADYYRHLVRELGFDCGERAPSVAASPQSAERTESMLAKHRWPADARFVAVMPGAAYGQAKQWPPDRMAELVSRVVKEHNMRVIVLGAAADRPAARAIESWLRDRSPESVASVLDLTGQTSLGVLIGLLSRAVLCVSNDSGGMHVAAAIGTPVVAVFGPTDERITRPLGDHVVITEPVFCRPCMLRDCPIDHRCMKRISATRVTDAASERLRSGDAV